MAYLRRKSLRSPCIFVPCAGISAYLYDGCVRADVVHFLQSLITHTDRQLHTYTHANHIDVMSPFDGGNAARICVRYVHFPVVSVRDLRTGWQKGRVRMGGNGWLKIPAASNQVSRLVGR